MKFPESYSVTERRLYYMEKKTDQDTAFGKQYCEEKKSKTMNKRKISSQNRSSVFNVKFEQIKNIKSFAINKHVKIDIFCGH